MANSRKSRRSSGAATDLVSHVARTIRDFVRRGDRVTVALSGGIDSIVLLDVLERLAGRRALHLSALHVNHQISPRAAGWAAFCRKVCNARSIPLRVVHVSVQRGDSLEAAARAARYDVFRAQCADHVVLAHNRDDQAETVVLQLLRGAGVKGLSAMPVFYGTAGGHTRDAANAPGVARRQMADPTPVPSVLRPLLDVPRSVIADYAGRRKLQWINDESNEDHYFVRNFVRHEVLPLIAQRFPSYRATFARTARHLAEAAQMLEDLAAIDGAASVFEDSLRVDGLRQLTRPRAKNLLRHFLRGRGVGMPNAERLEEAMRQALTARKDASVCIDLGEFELRRFGGRLYVVAKRKGASPEFRRAWHGENRIAIPDFHGVLTMTKGRGVGISLSKLQSRRVSIAIRRGGETIQLDPRRPRRSLKKLFQESHIPPWERERLPLLFAGRELVWVPEIGIAVGYEAAPNECSVKPEWKFDSTQRNGGVTATTHTDVSTGVNSARPRRYRQRHNDSNRLYFKALS